MTKTNTAAANSTHQITKDFVLGGRAIFTVSNPTGERYTFKVTRKDPEEGSRYTTPTFFVSLLTGADNESDYTYMGILSWATGEVKLTRASRYTDKTTAVLVVRWAMAKLWQAQALPAGYAVHHEGRCGRCGRLLTVPESIVSGFGPDCSERMGLVAGWPKLPVDANGMDSVDRAEIAQGVQ
jgi:hypothetical protein